MTWMLTASGTVVDLLRPQGAVFSISDIGHHLSQINRYTGAARRPFSVAEHSLLVCEILERERGERDPSVLLAALMHDAHEAYTQDLSSPAKRAVGAAWGEFENRVQFAVLKHHGLITAYTAARERIRWADRTALATERAALLPSGGPEWGVTRTHPPVTWHDFDRFSAYDWESWRDAFELRYQALVQARDIRAAEIAAPASLALGAAAITLCQRLVHPEDLGHAVSVEVRQLAKEALSGQVMLSRGGS
jgi:hypothetical protein